MLHYTMSYGMRALGGLALLWLAGCESSSAASCLTNPGVCSAGQTCNAQTARCASPDGGGISTWTQISMLTTSDLSTVWGSSGQDVWASGLSGALLHYTGSAWAADPGSGVATQAAVGGLWGSASQDVWAVGETGLLLRFNGSTWTADPMSQRLNSADFHGAWGSSKQNVWAVGEAGSLLHYTGAAWVNDPQANKVNANELFGVHGQSAQDLWVVGEIGTLLHYNGSTWTADPQSQTATLNTLHGVWSSSARDVWAVGKSRHAAALRWPSLDPGCGQQLADPEHPERSLGERRARCLGRGQPGYSAAL